jgi:peptidoglycan/xylan/chitin deacetylase (PgdA/CDA1 family)
MHHNIILWLTLVITNIVNLMGVVETNQSRNFPIDTDFNEFQQIPSESWPGEKDASSEMVSISPYSSDSLNPDISIHLETSRSEWIQVGPGAINVPILLYHHVCPCPTPNWLETNSDIFEYQMQFLVRHGFQTITTTQLREAILQGALLPPKPIIITFDDGYENIFEHAFPIMEKYGLTGTIYVIAECIGDEGFASVDQLLELSAAGWEIGSHTMLHKDLTLLSPSQVKIELLSSRIFLQEVLGIEIHSLAYPFGLFNEEIARSARNYGYSTAMGLGLYVYHGSYSLYYLNRQPIDGSDAMQEFLSVYKRTSGY